MSFRYRHPLTVIREGAAGDEHVDMGMPLEGAGPSVQHSESCNAATKISSVTAQGCKRVKCRLEKHRQQLTLVAADDESELVGQSEDDVEVRHG